MVMHNEYETEVKGYVHPGLLPDLPKPWILVQGYNALGQSLRIIPAASLCFIRTKQPAVGLTRHKAWERMTGGACAAMLKSGFRVVALKYRWLVDWGSGVWVLSYYPETGRWLAEREYADARAAAQDGQRPPWWAGDATDDPSAYTVNNAMLRTPEEIDRLLADAMAGSTAEYSPLMAHKSAEEFEHHLAQRYAEPRPPKAKIRPGNIGKHARQEGRFRRWVRAMFRRQMMALGAALPNMLVGYRFVEDDGLDEQVDEWIDTTAEELAQLRAIILDTLALGADDGVYAVNANTMWSLRSPEAIAWAREHAAQLVTGLNDTTRDQVLAAIREDIATGLEEGLSRDQVAEMIANDLDGIVQDMETWRSRLIAQTEITAAHGQGRLQYLRSIDAEAKVWLDGQPRACPICEAADGEVVAIDDEFSTGTVAPPAHPGCRCDMDIATRQELEGAA